MRQLVVPAVSLSSLCVLALILSTAVITVRQPYHGVSWSLNSGLVYGVDQGSPGAAAGMRFGDRILSIDGVPRQAASDLYAARRVGDQLALVVLRDAQAQSVTLRLVSAPPLILAQRLLPPVVALCFALFSFFIWGRKPYDRAIGLFLLFNQLGAAGLATGLLSALRFRSAYIWFDLCLALLAAALVHFHLVFPQPAPLSKRLLVMPALYGGGLLIVFLDWLHPDDAANPFRFATRFYLLLAIGVSAALLVRSYHTARSAVDRWALRLIVAGTVLAFVPLIGLSLLPEVLSRPLVVPYALTFPFLLLIPIAYAIAIRRDLLRIDQFVNRSVVNLTLLLILGVVYFIVVSLAHRWPAISDQPLLWGLLTLLLAVSFAPLRALLQRVVDRLFYGGWYNYRSVLDEMSRALNGVVDATTLSRQLVQQLRGHLRLSGTMLLLATDEQTLEVVDADQDRAPRARPSLPDTGALAGTLLRSAQPMDTAELQAALAYAPLREDEHTWLYRSEVSLWVPLISRGALQGLLLLLPKIGDEPFDAEDRRILATLAWQAAIAAENTRLVASLRRRADEVNQLYSQLVNSREAERKRLARELHDQIIQDLINLHYYLDVDAPRLASTEHEHAHLLRREVQQVIHNLREVCTELRPAALDDLSFSLAVQGYVEEIRSKYGTKIQLELPGEEESLTYGLPEEVGLCLFRTLQEALTNARRHAQADQVAVAVELAADYVALTVSDNGRGFRCPASLSALIRTGHFGLAGIQERVHLVGGVLQIESASGQGTLLRAVVPVTGGIPDSTALLTPQETSGV